jgi:hypothetical protein
MLSARGCALADRRSLVAAGTKVYFAGGTRCVRNLVTGKYDCTVQNTVDIYDRAIPSWSTEILWTKR